MAEQGCLLSSYPDKIGIGGSNPPLSAKQSALSLCSQFRSRSSDIRPRIDESPHFFNYSLSPTNILNGGLARILSTGVGEVHFL